MMAGFSIFFGLLLTSLGLITYFGAIAGWFAAKASPTALIPAGAGVLLILLGAMALRPAMRKHAMHTAAMIALLGVIAPLGRLISVAVEHKLVVSTASVSQGIMALLCAIFLVLCIRSFIAARRNRVASQQV
ncbi:MAG TPA: hypothetical protein VG722_11255, partial [Tepidisphaeraceae bacterium]|nr:hypothetical protein [Tepidisphaeraceae bacterium]